VVVVPRAPGIGKTEVELAPQVQVMIESFTKKSNCVGQLLGIDRGFFADRVQSQIREPTCSRHQ